MRQFIIVCSVIAGTLGAFERVGSVVSITPELIGIRLDTMVTVPGTRIMVVDTRNNTLSGTLVTEKRDDSIVYCSVESGNITDFSLGQEARVETKDDRRRIFPFGLGYGVVLFAPTATLAQLNTASTMVGYDFSYNAIIDNAYITLHCTALFTQTVSINGGFDLKYILGAPGVPIALFPLIGLGIGYSEIKNASSDDYYSSGSGSDHSYLSGSLGGGILLFPHNTFQIEIAARYLLPLVEGTYFNNISGLQVSIGGVYYFTNDPKPKR